MKRWAIRVAMLAGLGLSIAMVAIGARASYILAGYKAKMLCSEVLIGGRDRAAVLTDLDVSPRPAPEGSVGYWPLEALTTPAWDRCARRAEVKRSRTGAPQGRAAAKARHGELSQGAVRRAMKRGGHTGPTNAADARPAARSSETRPARASQ